MKNMSRRQLLNRAAYLSMIGAGYSLLNAGCVELGGNVGGLDLNKAMDIFESSTKLYTAGSKAFEDITPEQEYYIGRTIGAVVFEKYPPYQKSSANSYVNLLGQTLSRFSSLPVLYEGYHFIILDSEDINAFATPSGLIMVSRGLIQCCKDEEMLAAVLAHEIAHVQYRHGMNAIKKSRITNLLTVAALEGTKNFASQDVGQVTSIFEDTIDDIVSTMVNSGYSRSQEYEADAGAVEILEAAGYQSGGLVEMLKEMDKNLVADRHDFAATHPAPEDRIEALSDLKLAPSQSYTGNSIRKKRFLSKMKNV